MRTISVAAVQLRAHDRSNFEATWPAIIGGIRETACGGAQLIVLPEGTVPAYVLGEAPVDRRIVESAVKELCDISKERRVVIVCGIARIDGTETYNSAVVVDSDGSVAGYASKVFLWHFDRRWFSVGKHIRPIQTSIGVLGVLVCADGRQPAIAAHLVDAGAEILVMPTAWVTSGRNPNELENVQADLLARIRARENAVPFVAANKCGVEQNCVGYCGKSQIIDAQGNVLAIASQHNPATITHDVKLSPSTPLRYAQDDKKESSASAVLKESSPSVMLSVAPKARSRSTVRIALSMHDDIGAAMQTIEATLAITPGAPDRMQDLDAAIPIIRVDDATIANPVGLISYRRAGYQLVVWEVGDHEPAWIESLARARALELRLYVAVLDRAGERAYAIDPDGVVIAGTFGDYQVTSFLFDPARTEQTLVAPGTDVVEGIEHVQRIIENDVLLAEHGEH